MCSAHGQLEEEAQVRIGGRLISAPIAHYHQHWHHYHQHWRHYHQSWHQHHLYSCYQRQKKPVAGFTPIQRGAQVRMGIGSPQSILLASNAKRPEESANQCFPPKEHFQSNLWLMMIRIDNWNPHPVTRPLSRPSVQTQASAAAQHLTIGNLQTVTPSQQLTVALPGLTNRNTQYQIWLWDKQACLIWLIKAKCANPFRCSIFDNWQSL